MLNKLKIISYLSTTDWCVFGLVMALTFAVAVYGHYRQKKPQNTALDYLLMGRQLTLPLFVATLVATWYGGIFGVNEITFNYGIYNFVTQGFFWYVAYIIFAFFIAEKVAKYQSVTLPDLAENMFGPKAGKVAALFTFFYITPVAYVLSLGIFLNMIFGIGVLNGMIIGTVFTCIYTAWGGFKAVVFSDLVQFFVMCSAVLLVVLFSLQDFGGISFLKTHLPPSHFSLTGGNGILNTLIWGFIALSTLIDPSFYQRCFAAKSPQIVKKGVLISTLIWFCFDICTTLGSLYARALLPTAEPAEAYFFYAIQLLPTGLKGFFVAGILAIILSTLNSFLFIASNTLSYDLLKHRFKNIIFSNRIALFVVGGLAIAMAQLLDGSFKEIWITLGSYFSACLLVPILVGYIYPKRISDRLFVCSALSSAAVMTAWKILPLSGFWAQIDGFYIGVSTSIVILLLNKTRKNKNVQSTIDL
ncbi:MAG: sodium:solute symporter family protein [Elusimicrobiaceae bacterium]|nr:sodium:solute symporter family protein [Elusimicrobiaceae bacterium]